MHVPEQTGRPIGGGNGTIAYRGVAFVLPSQPAVSVEVHIYTDSGPSISPVFELLVIYIVPLPKPAAENLPNDIQNVRIDYLPNTANHRNGQRLVELGAGAYSQRDG